MTEREQAESLELLKECFINFEAWETCYPIYSPTDEFMDKLGAFLSAIEQKEKP